MPAYNEADIIAEAVASVATELQKIPGIDWRIIVADNGSSDGTGAIVEALGNPAVSVLSISKKGKGNAIVETARASSADVFGFIDADLSADPRHIAELLAHLRDADIAIGSRLHKEAVVDRGVLRSLSSEVFNLMRKLALGLTVADTQCGLKLANVSGKKHLVLCQESGWFLDVEWLARLDGAGLTIREVPISWTEQRFSDRESKLNVVTDGLRALGAFVRIRNRLQNEA